MDSYLFNIFNMVLLIGLKNNLEFLKNLEKKSIKFYLLEVI